MSKIPITVLLSGDGSNLQCLIDAQESSAYQIIKVITNRKAAFGLQRAEKAKIPTAYHNLIPYRKQHATLGDGQGEQKAREAYDADLATLIIKDSPALVVCAGFMHVFSPRFIEPLNRAGIDIINLHPGMCNQLIYIVSANRHVAKWGAIDGKDAIARAHAAFMRGEIEETGVMIHYVIVQVDRGEPLIQEIVSLSHPADDKLEDLEERMHEVEHRLIVEGTKLAIEKLKDRSSIKD